MYCPGMLTSFRDVINRWDRLPDFANEVGITPLLARAWRRRNSIPVSHFNAVVAAAQKRGFAEITTQLLVDLAAKPNRPAEAA